MRAPVEHIEAPPFPLRLPWIGGPVRMHEQLGHPVLIEFWDFCRVQSIRTQPYVNAWYKRYESAGLRVIGVHASGYAASRDPDVVRAAVARLGVRYPVVVDTELEIWSLYGNLGWPARYLFNGSGMLFHYHYGEGGYDETERSIQELLGIDGPLLPARRPEEEPGARLEPQSDDVEGPYSGPYRAGGVWAVLEGSGEVRANGRTFTVDHAGCYELVTHPRSTAGELDLEIGRGVTCHAVCFTPGLAE